MDEWQPICEAIPGDEEQVVFGYWVKTGDRYSWASYLRRRCDPPSAATHYLVIADPPPKPLNLGPSVSTNRRTPV
jgi:hypothetical protein